MECKNYFCDLFDLEMVGNCHTNSDYFPVCKTRLAFNRLIDRLHREKKDERFIEIGHASYALDELEKIKKELNNGY